MRLKLNYLKKNKQQSALEFLITYSWAILIIIIVIGLFIYYVVFGNTNSSVVQQPGECTVYRPSVVIGSSQPSLKGICDDAPPEYVAQFNGNSYISFPQVLNFNTAPFTITFWEYYFSYTNCYTSSNGGNCDENITLYINPNKCSSSSSYVCVITFDLRTTMLHWFTWARDIFYNPVQTGKWYFIAWTYNPAQSNNQSAFINGTLVGTNTGTNIVLNGNIQLGASGGAGGINGYISNVQIYNTSLSSSEIRALYQEGIGGAPIRLQNLVAWWPLNGNANDYSGNGNNGQINNVNFVSNWQNSYTAP